MKTPRGSWKEILISAQEENDRVRPEADRTVRLAATIADILLFSLGLSVSTKLISAAEIALSNSPIEDPISMATRIFAILCIALAYFPYATTRWGGTIGKQLLGLRVTDLSGKPVPFLKSALRELLMKYTAAVISLGVIPMLYLSGGSAQPIHDKWLGTTVKKVRGRM